MHDARVTGPGLARTEGRGGLGPAYMQTPDASSQGARAKAPTTDADLSPSKLDFMQLECHPGTNPNDPQATATPPVSHGLSKSTPHGPHRSSGCHHRDRRIRGRGVEDRLRAEAGVWRQAAVEWWA